MISHNYSEMSSSTYLFSTSVNYVCSYIKFDTIFKKIFLYLFFKISNTGFVTLRTDVICINVGSERLSRLNFFFITTIILRPFAGYRRWYNGHK